VLGSCNDCSSKLQEVQCDPVDIFDFPFFVIIYCFLYILLNFYLLFCASEMASCVPMRRYETARSPHVNLLSEIYFGLRWSRINNAIADGALLIHVGC